MRQADEIAAPKTKGEQNSLARDESGASHLETLCRPVVLPPPPSLSFDT